VCKCFGGKGGGGVGVVDKKMEMRMYKRDGGKGEEHPPAYHKI